MAAYDILDTYWYTPNWPGQDALQQRLSGLPTIAVVFVAIKSLDNWKCYMGWVAAEMDPLAAAQLIASAGMKVQPNIARAHFPSLVGSCIY